VERGKNGHFAPGNEGGPGRPKGSRSKLSESYLKALADDFEEHGLETIVRLREDRPDIYVGAIGKLMPKLLDISGDIEHEHIVREVIKEYTDGDGS
jgi:hypothetical protein